MTTFTLAFTHQTATETDTAITTRCGRTYNRASGRTGSWMPCPDCEAGTTWGATNTPPVHAPITTTPKEN